jgi:hypothetical protein
LGKLVGEFQIPESLAIAIRKAWPDEEELAPHARKYGLLRRLFTRERILVKRTLPSEPTLAFWSISSDEDMTNFLFDGLLPALENAGTRKPMLKGFPAGYKPLRDVLHFEQHCQWDGLTGTVTNHISDMPEVISAYRFLRLKTVAEGLSRALSVAKAQRIVDDTTDDALEHAYASAANTHEFSNAASFRVRMAAIGSFIRRNPSCFSVGNDV